MRQRERMKETQIFMGFAIAMRSKASQSVKRGEKNIKVIFHFVRRPPRDVTWQKPSR